MLLFVCVHKIRKQIKLKKKKMFLIVIFCLLIIIAFSKSKTKRYNKWTTEAEDKVAEVTSKTIASDLLPIIEGLSNAELEIMLPKLKHLYSNQSTSITMAWLTFEPLARQLGPNSAIEHLLR